MNVTATSPRDLVPRMRELRAEGKSATVIGRMLGIPESTVRNWWNAGTCDACGAATDGSNGRAKAPKFCRDCAPPSNLGHYGYGRMQRKTLAFLTEPRGFTEIRDNLGVTNEHMGQHLGRLMRHGLIRRVSRGVYVAKECS